MFIVAHFGSCLCVCVFKQTLLALIVEYLLLMQDQEIYDATLNQTNVGQNNNKFYVIQALGAFLLSFLF